MENLHVLKGCGSRKLLPKFPEKNCTIWALKSFVNFQFETNLFFYCTSERFMVILNIYIVQVNIVPHL